MAFFGSIEHFNPEKNDFKDYSERMDQFFIVNKVQETMKVPMLITLIGPETYSVLKDLVSPESPATKTYAELIETLTRHYIVKKSTIAARYAFYQCQQQEHQTVNDFVVEIKRKAAQCKFGTFLKEALRDRFVCGLLNKALVQMLLIIGDSLSFEGAVKLATASVAAEEGTSNIQLDEPKSKRGRPAAPVTENAAAKATPVKRKAPTSPAKKKAPAGKAAGRPAKKGKKASSDEEEDEDETSDKDEESGDTSDTPGDKTAKQPPTDDEITNYLKQFLKGADLEQVTMKSVCKQVYSHYPDFDLEHKKDFIKDTVKSII